MQRHTAVGWFSHDLKPHSSEPLPWPCSRRTSCFQNCLLGLCCSSRLAELRTGLRTLLHTILPAAIQMNQSWCLRLTLFSTPWLRCCLIANALPSFLKRYWGCCVSVMFLLHFRWLTNVHIF